jgi:glycosyltransferase involved in cell wall biosynthesis
LKVAIVAPLVSPIREPQRGGSQAFVSRLARGLVDRGHEVHLYAASESHVAGVEVIDTGVDHRDLEATLYRAGGPVARALAVAEDAFAGVYGAVRDAGYDVVHNHAFDAPAIRLATASRAPVVHTLHLPPDTEVADALRGAGGSAGRGEPAPTVACVSASQASAWRRVVPVDAILPPYVPTRLIGFSPNAGEGAVFAGRLSAEKGAAEAIEIARVAGLRIDVFGDSYDDEYTRARIDPWRGEPGVALHQGVPQSTLWEAMARAAVVLCPTRWDEPFGMVAAEAQACGTPVVAFHAGALDEVIVDGVTGFLVAPGDVGAAAAAVRSARALSRSDCRRHAERHLDLELSLDTHERLYEHVASAGLGATVCG